MKSKQKFFAIFSNVYVSLDAYKYDYDYADDIFFCKSRFITYKSGRPVGACVVYIMNLEFIVWWKWTTPALS